MKNCLHDLKIQRAAGLWLLLFALSPGLMHAHATVPPSSVANRAPVLVGGGEFRAKVGQGIGLMVHANDPDPGQTLTYLLTTAPSNATINSKTGAISWVPEKAGTFTFRVKARDNGTPVLFDEKIIIATVTNPIAPDVRINSGGAAYNGPFDDKFTEDKYFSGSSGTTYVSGDILETTNDELFRSQRTSPAFQYKIPVTNATMYVILYFSETNFLTNGAGKRKFNVDIEGARKLTDYDIYAEAGGSMKANYALIEVTVSDGMLNIDFSSGSAGIPALAAIAVSYQTTTVTLDPSDDAFVRSGSGKTLNYGNSDSLYVKTANNPDYTRRTFFKFQLASIGQVTTAKLRIYGANIETSEPLQLEAYGVLNDDWAESSITWNNVPTIATSLQSSVTVNDEMKYYELDISEFIRSQVAGDNVATIHLRSSSPQNRNMRFHSTENATYRPYLIIETDSGPMDITSARLAYESATNTSKSSETSSKVYPNPASRHFNVELAEQHQNDITMQMISSGGHTYNINTVWQQHSGTTRDVDLSRFSLSDGVYFLRIKSAEASEVVKVLVSE